MVRTREHSDVFNTLDEIYLVFTSKKVNILYVTNKKKNAESVGVTCGALNKTFSSPEPKAHW